MQKSDDYTNSTKLYAMNVARENELIVTDISADGAMDDSGIERLSDTYTLNITNEKPGGSTATYALQFRGTQTILEIKANVYTITNIAVRHQDWIGWPPDVTNDTLLGLSGVPQEYNLTLRSTEPLRMAAGSSAAAAAASQAIVVAMADVATATASTETIEVDSDSSVDEFEDASDFNGEDDIFTSNVTNNRLKHLSEYLLCG